VATHSEVRLADRHPLRRAFEATKTTLIVIFVLVLAGLGAWSAVRGRGPLGPSLVAREECRAAYRRARTPGDSAAVDRLTPVVSKGQAAFAKSCALMRRDGDLAAGPGQ
jgi:hypothetical protein